MSSGKAKSYILGWWWTKICGILCYHSKKNISVTLAALCGGIIPPVYRGKSPSLCRVVCWALHISLPGEPCTPSLNDGVHFEKVIIEE